MLEMTAECQACGATLVLPLPDAWQTPEGALIDDDRMSIGDNEAQLKAMMESMKCPNCGQARLQAGALTEGSPEGVIPVYLQYVMPLERYVEVKADTMDEAKALVKQMLRDGQIQRPSYTEGLDDWTEITDVTRGYFRLDGEAL
jgi:hypothetical protein